MSETRGRDADLPLRVLIADDHPLMIRSLIGVLEQAGMTVVATAASAGDAVRAAAAFRPDVSLLDVRMPPGEGGLDAARQILVSDPNAVVVCLSAEDDVELVERVLSLGCLGFVSKLADPDEFAPTISLARSTRRPHFDRRTAASVVAAAQRRFANNVRRQLTEREVAVLQFAADGASNVEIADRLNLSRTSVAAALNSVFQKLGVNDRTAAAVSALREGLIR